MAIFIRKCALFIALNFSWTSLGMAQDNWPNDSGIFAAPADSFSKKPKSRNKARNKAKNKKTKPFINTGHRSCGFPVRQKRFIFGRDNRKPVPKKHAYLQGMIGYLFNSKNQEFCNAFCVDPDLIATASFCLPKVNATTNFTFITRLGKKNSIGSPIKTDKNGNSQHYIIRGTNKVKTRTPLNSSDQWAVAKLAVKICNSGYLKIKSLSKKALAKASREKKISMSSFSLNFTSVRTLSYEKDCGICNKLKRVSKRLFSHSFKNPQKTLLHRCDIGSGSAGAPLLLQTPKGLVAVAIQTGGFHQRRLLVSFKGNKKKVLKTGKFYYTANIAVHISQIQKAIKTLQKR